MNSIAAYQYNTGEDVQTGDVVVTANGRHGVVKKVISPGTRDYDWACPNGGILVEEDWDGTPSLLSIPVGAKAEWEDLKFVR